MGNYGEHEVFAKGATGPDVVIQFQTRDRASQFFKDNFEKFKDFKVEGTAGETRNTFFNLYLNESQWKLYHATRLLAKHIELSKVMEQMPVKALKHKGIISIDNFDLVKLVLDDDGHVKHKYFEQNVNDIGVEGIKEKINVVAEGFLLKFK